MGEVGFKGGAEGKGTEGEGRVGEEEEGVEVRREGGREGRGWSGGRGFVGEEGCAARFGGGEASFEVGDFAGEGGGESGGWCLFIVAHFESGMYLGEVGGGDGGEGGWEWCRVERAGARGCTGCGAGRGRA